MGSQRNEQGGLRGLVTPYIAVDQGKERQFICLRVKADGRKLVVIGCFDVAKKDALASFIFGIMQQMVIDSPANK